MDCCQVPFIVIKELIGLILYIFDVGTDINAAIHYISMGKYWWGGMTITFAVLPMLIASLWIAIIPEMSNNGRSIPMKFLLVLKGIVCSPIIPFGILLNSFLDKWDKCADHNDNNSDDELADIFAQLVKLFDTIWESYPQLSIQMFIVFQDLHDGIAIGYWQWLTIATSLTALAFSVSTSYIFDDAKTYSKVIFFIFGMLSVVSRLMIFCIFSMTNSLWWFIPFFTEVFASIIMWTINRWCRCSMYEPLFERNHICNIWDIVQVIHTWMLVSVYDCFTWYGMVISIINLMFAVGSYFFLDVPKYIAIIALTLAAFIGFINVIFFFCFKGIGNNFKGIRNGENRLTNSSDSFESEDNSNSVINGNNTS